jgi:hypothetical protein
VCNTAGVIHLENVNISSSGTTFLKASAPSADDPDTNTDWGNDGGTVTFTAANQILDGNIVCDEYSTIDLTLSDSSSLEGAVNTDDACQVSLTLDENSSWIATDNSYVADFNGVVLNGGVPANVDAATGITIYYSSMTDENGNSLSGTYTLPSGGQLLGL